MVGTDELILLFRGDGDSLGYAHAEIVVEICSRTGKDTTPSVEWMIAMLYPEKELVPFHVTEIITSGVQLWYHRNRPRHLVT